MANKTGQNTPQSVDIRGILYPSMRAAARDLDVTISTIRAAMKAGRLDTVGLMGDAGRPIDEEKFYRRVDANGKVRWIKRRNAKQRDAIIEMVKQNIPSKDISLKLDISVQSVYSIVCKARKDGLLPRVSLKVSRRCSTSGYKIAQYYTRKRGVKIGTFAEILEFMPAPVMTWLADQIPEGGTMAELISAIITDAYNEEN